MYNIKTKTFYDADTGLLVPNRIQELLNDKDFAKGVKAALKILGE